MSSPQSPPRLNRVLTGHPSPNGKGALTLAQQRGLASSTSIENLISKASTQDLPKITTSSTVARSRARSVSSNAVPSMSSFSAGPLNLGRTPVSPLLDDFLHHPDRGPGTPDFTLSSTPASGRAERERSRTMNSLGQGLQVLSNVENAPFGLGVMAGPSERPSRSRSSSDASYNKSDEDSPKKRSISKATQGLQRPKLAGLHSFISSLTNGATESSNEGQVSSSSHPAAPSWQAPRPARPQPLVMPAARPAGPQGLRGFNADSPPLTPTSDSEEYIDYCAGGKAPSSTPRQARHYGAPKHQWSAAAANAAHMGYDDPLQSQFTPPLTTSSGRSSPVVSSRAFSPPTRPDSTMTPSGFHLYGLLPSHLVASQTSRPPTPVSMHTNPSDRPFRPSMAWDADSFKVDNLSRTLRALLPRISINMSSWQVTMPPIRPFLPRMVLLAIIFMAATICIVFMLSTLPLTMPRHVTSLTLSEIKDIALSLKTYSGSSPKARTHTLLVISALFTWKQSFTIPGSLIMNVVFGAMYGTYWGTFYTSIFTAVGGVFCYLLSAPLAPLITSLPGLAKPLDAMRRALSPGRAHASGRSAIISNSRRSSNGSLWSYLLLLRVLPIIPYGLMNIACGVLGVPLTPYALTLAVGSIPWNFVTCQVGDILQEIVEALPVTADGIGGGGMKEIAKHIWNKEMLVKLILLSVASLMPMLLSKYLKRKKEEGYESINMQEGEMANRRSDEENDRQSSRHSSRLSRDMGWFNERFTHTREGTDDRQSAWL